jgi:hypothetical protein
MGAKKGHYLMFLIRFGTPNESMSFWNVKVIMHSFWFIFEEDIQNLFQ